MMQRIAGYHQDSDGHWVAELECGHNQHVRHEPHLHINCVVKRVPIGPRAL